METEIAHLTNFEYDLCILGAGPAGYAAAMRAHDLGKRVALVERASVGGAGVHRGALSSKTLWHLANDYSRLSKRDRGYVCNDVSVQFADVRGCVDEATTEREALDLFQLDKLQTPDPRGAFVHHVRGSAQFVNADTIEVRCAQGNVRQLRAAHYLIATGSRPRIPDNIVVDGTYVMTSDQIESQPDFPESLVIVGAGVIGCEYATIFANFGKTKISIIDRQPRILPFEDADVAAVVAARFEALGVCIHREAKLTSLAVVDGHVEYGVEGANGEVETHRVARALVSIGRVPNVEDLNLPAAGIVLDARGGVQVQGTQTSNPKVHAAGDVTADVALVNIAELEGRFAVESMFGLTPKPLVYEALSAIMFLAPEVASCGLNEQMAKKKGIPYRVGVVHNQLVARNIAMRATDGFIKLLAEREAPHRILGLRVVGPQAASTVQGVAFLIERGGTLDDIEHCIHPHPAIPEGVQECARLLLGRSRYKADVFGESLLRVGEG
jgi:dihydrolipoamide dehydrogenase